MAFAPSALAAQLDTVTVTGSAPPYDSANITAQSGTSGQNPSGTASVSAFGLTVSGPVTCLRVTGPDRGGGTVTSPTTALLNFQDPRGVLTVQVVDNGGNGMDEITVFAGGRAPTDCSGNLNGQFFGTLANGRAVVFDAPVLPTSKDQCKDGGWQNFSQFKNQGDCVSFVGTSGKNQPG